MIAPTHVTFAEFIYLLILTTTGVSLSIVNALVIGMTSLLPDIDTRPSFFGVMFPSLSLTIERRFGHRTITHSGIFTLAIAVIFSPLLIWDRDLYICVCVGYVSHLFLDTMTVNGVKLFYPFSSARCVFPLEVNHPRRYRVRSGSRIDWVLAFVFLIACGPTLYIAAQGYERFIRTTQKNIESAVRDYNEFSRTNEVYADFTAHDLLTKVRLAGSFEVIGSLNHHTLLFRGADRRLHSLGNEYQSEFVVENVVCRKGRSVRVAVSEVDMENQPLMQIQRYIDTTQENQFFGLLNTPDRFSGPQDGTEFSPITGSGGVIKLNYAFYDDIRGLALENLFITRGVVTVRTIVPDSGGTDSSRRGAFLPGGEFLRLSYQVSIRDSIQFLCRKGDSVTADQLLARWGAPFEIQNRVDLNLRKIDMLARDLHAKILEIDARIAKAASVAATDSLACVAAGKLERDGYSTPAGPGRAEAKYRASRMFVTRLRTARLDAGMKCEIQKQRLSNENQQLIVRQALVSARSTIRSSARGVIADIRQMANLGKVLVTIIIRRT